MNSSSDTLFRTTRVQTSRVPVSDFCHATYAPNPEKAFELSRFSKIAAFIFATSSITTMADPWLLEKQRREAVITVSSYQKYVHLISRAEALRITRNILEQAEQERIAIADWEAERGIQWSDIA